MGQKVKIAIIGLVVILFISFILILQITASKQSLERQIQQLTNENKNLSRQAEDALRQKRTFQEQINSLDAGFKKVSQEKDELQARFELVDKARQELIQQLSASKTQATAQPQSQPTAATLTPSQAPPQTDEGYWGELLKTKAGLEFQLGDVRNELKNLQIANEQLQREKGGLQIDLTAFKRDNEDLKRQLEYSQKTMNSLSGELVREKNDKLQIDRNLRLIKSENIALRRQLESLSSRKVGLEKRVSELLEKNIKLDNRFAEVEMILRDRLLQIEDIKKQTGQEASEEKKESVELAPITVRPQDTSFQESESDSSSDIGRVAAVNRDNNFVIVDLGRNPAVKIGDTLRVYRRDKQIASVEVIQTRNSIIACDIKQESVSIKVGDSVKY